MALLVPVRRCRRSSTPRAARSSGRRPPSFWDEVLVMTVAPTMGATPAHAFAQIDAPDLTAFDLDPGFFVNAGVILRRDNFDPLLMFSPKVTTYRVLRSVCSATRAKQRCAPHLRKVRLHLDTCGGRLAPRRANERYTAEPSALARLVCQAYHRCPGRTRLSPPLPQLAHSWCPQSRASPPQGAVGCFCLTKADFRARVRSHGRRCGLRQFTCDHLPSKPARLLDGLSCGNWDP